jgi:hypothetical protein
MSVDFLKKSLRDSLKGALSPFRRSDLIDMRNGLIDEIYRLIAE